MSEFFRTTSRPKQRIAGSNGGYSLLRRAAWAGLLLGLAATAAAGIYLWRAGPALDGSAALPGLRAELHIERDAHGIPTVRASSLHDLMFGLGVVHAQDRLWQLETHKRIGAGRLAEAFGPPALEADRFLRAVGVRRAAQAQWQRVQGESREVLQAYADGINAVVAQWPVRPPEMLLLGVQPEPWSAVDSLSWATMMAWDLGHNWAAELLRMRLALKLPVPRIHELMPPSVGEAAPATADFAALYRSLKLGSALSGNAAAERVVAHATGSGIEGLGSNNWALAGTHTTSGRPLLANDPHLKLSAPALWYLVRLELTGGTPLKVAGATIPGLPMLVAGQSEHIAWGLTNTAPDVQDLYLERLDPADPMRYQTPDGWARFEQAQETIRVKGADAVSLPLRTSRHGPVISDAGIANDLIGTPDKAAHAIALRWTALDADADTIGVGLAIVRARSVAEFIDAARGYVAPMQNMVVADAGGHIGFVAAGRVPLRRADNDLHGLAPAPGWDARYDWAGWLPPEQTPREVDPARGWVASANQRITPPGYPHFIGSDWALPYRQQRIEQLLRARPLHSIDDMAAMQADLKSLAVAPLLPWLHRAQSRHPLAVAAQRELDGFDGTMAPERAAPLIFWAWVRHLTAAVFADELGSLYERSLPTRSFRDALEGVLARDDAWWCDDKGTAALETCSAQASVAFTRALQELQARYGPDLERWSWSKAHQARAEHRPFSKVALLAPWFELRTSVGGDTYSLNVTRVGLSPEPRTGELYLAEHGASLRALYDLGDPAQSRVMLSGGQSGLPWSAHYRDLLGPWARGAYVPLWPQAAPERALTLRPLPP